MYHGKTVSDFAVGVNVPMDMPSLSIEALGGDDSKFVWPVPYDHYLNASDHLYELIIKSVYDPGLPEIVGAAAVAVLGAVLVDADRAVKTALELHAAKAAGMKTAYDPRHSPVCAFLLDNAAMPADGMRISDYFPEQLQKINPLDILRGIAARAVTAWNMRATSGSGRMDMHNSSPLLENYLEYSRSHPVLLRAERWPEPMPDSPPSEIVDLARKIGSAVKTILQETNCERGLIQRAAMLSEQFILERLIKAHVQADAIANMGLLDHAGSVLVGGTPKDIGRLINWRYQKLDRKTWRFAHGGDRAFFDDPMWPLTEFPFVDRYHVHGAGEAHFLTVRYQTARTLMPPSGMPEFLSYGSRKHQRWFEQGRSESSKRVARSSRRVMLVPGSFLGERHMAPLNFKLPDALAADIQAHIIKTLIDAGFDVVVKPHPKGLFTDEKPHAGMGAELIAGSFDPVAMDVDCFVFEFAGSAFFDALSGNKGVVLIDTLHRPWDENSRRDLEKRCEIVSAVRDEHNRIRAPKDTLIDSINRACERNACPDEFAEKFFYGDGIAR